MERAPTPGCWTDGTVIRCPASSLVPINANRGTFLATIGYLEPPGREYQNHAQKRGFGSRVSDRNHHSIGQFVYWSHMKRTRDVFWPRGQRFCGVHDHTGNLDNDCTFCARRTVVASLDAMRPHTPFTRTQNDTSPIVGMISLSHYREWLGNIANSPNYWEDW